MTVKWETVKAGDRLWEVRSERMGNTTMRRKACRPVDIVSIDHARGTARVVWNEYNPEETWTRMRVTSLRRSPPAEAS